MAEVQKSAFVPAAIHAQNGRIPDLFVTSGEVGVRGYAARFFNVNGELIKPSATQNLTCYALNLTTEKAYYTEGTYAEDTWYIEVPRQAVESDGRVAIQLALKEGDTALLITDTSVVDVHNFLGGDSSRPLDADNGILMDYQKLHAQAEAAAATLEAVTATANRAEELQKQAREDITKIEAKEASRNNAESNRQSAESARASAENTRKAQEEARVRAESARTGAESARVSAEKSRATVESARASAETGRVNAEKMRAEKESARQSTESARVEAEKKRVTAENARASAENTRASQENTRQANENTRKAQESARQSAESSRVSAEEKRKQIFDGWDKTMQGIIPQASETEAGVVKAKGTAQESAPYTVPSMGILDEELKKAGKVKSVNGMTGDVTIPKYTLPQATENTLGGVKIQDAYPGDRNSRNAATAAYVNSAVDQLGLDMQTVLEFKQDKIKQVTSVPTAETTARDPDGTVYAVISDDGQQGGAVGALTMADVEQMGLPVLDDYVYELDKTIDRYMLMKDFSVKPIPKANALKEGFYTKADYSFNMLKYMYGNDMLDAQFQYYDGASFIKKSIYGCKPFFERFIVGNFAIDYRDFDSLDKVKFGEYREGTNPSGFIGTDSDQTKNNCLIGKDKSMFTGIRGETLFPGCLIQKGEIYSQETSEFQSLHGSLYFLEKVDKTTNIGKTTYGYRSLQLTASSSDESRRTLYYLFSAYHPKSPIYVKNGGSVEPPQSLYMKHNGKIVKL